MIKIPTIKEIMERYDSEIEKETGDDPKYNDLKVVLKLNMLTQLKLLNSIFGEPK